MRWWYVLPMLVIIPIGRGVGAPRSAWVLHSAAGGASAARDEEGAEVPRASWWVRLLVRRRVSVPLHRRGVEAHPHAAGWP